MSLLPPRWSIVVVTPENSLTFIRQLPEATRELVLQAWQCKGTLWIEKSDLAKYSAVYALGGVAVDALDCKLHNAAKLEEFMKQHEIFMVPGNKIRAKGGSHESDTLACMHGVSCVPDLLQDIAVAILSRQGISRSTGAHWTIQIPWCSFAERHHIPTLNIVHRTMKTRLTCLPPDGYHVFSVVHAGEWCNHQTCPKSWLTGPPFKKKLLLQSTKDLSKPA